MFGRLCRTVTPGTWDHIPPPASAGGNASGWRPLPPGPGVSSLPFGAQLPSCLLTGVSPRPISCKALPAFPLQGCSVSFICWSSYWETPCADLQPHWGVNVSRVRTRPACQAVPAPGTRWVTRSLGNAPRGWVHGGLAGSESLGPRHWGQPVTRQRGWGTAAPWGLQVLGHEGPKPGGTM